MDWRFWIKIGSWRRLRFTLPSSPKRGGNSELAGLTGIILSELDTVMNHELKGVLEQRSPTFLAPGTSFVEDSFSTEGVGGGGGSGGNARDGEWWGVMGSCRWWSFAHSPAAHLLLCGPGIGDPILEGRLEHVEAIVSLLNLRLLLPLLKERENTLSCWFCK